MISRPFKNCRLPGLPRGPANGWVSCKLARGTSYPAFTGTSIGHADYE